MKDYAIIGLLGPEIRKRLPQILEDMEFPETVGPPLKEREKEIAQIDEKLAKIEAELQELEKTAKSAGISLD